MEDGAKEEPAQTKEPKFLGKAGWVKKAPSRLLASYKDRYVHVEKTEIVVYENEDLQNCLERVDLENYDNCHELKSPFKKKHRLILIRSHKSGNKVHDVKFQAQTAEEKEAWIKALVDGINRAKNKIFDEVTVDESSNLDHVTRTRPKGNRNRRPPTRIHMKEVADVSSDGILRLDLDLKDAMMPNGTHHASVDGTETPKEAVIVETPPSNASEAAEKQSGESTEEEAPTEPEDSPQKKVIKPPMPPTKEAKPRPPPEDEPDKDDGPEKKVLKPPMPPSKEAKPCVSPVEEDTEEAKAETKKTGPPPTPPNKPSSSSSTSNLAEASQPRPNSHPPTPPSKEKKPSKPAVEPDQDVQGDENKETEEGHEKEATGTDEADQSVSKDLPSDDEPDSPSAGGHVSGEESEETISGISKESSNEPQIPTEQLRRSPSPQSNEGQDPAALLQTASDTSASAPRAEEVSPKSEAPSIVVSVSDLMETEEKSVDSGQHSDDDSEGSGSEDTLAASTAALRGSHPSLDVLDTSEDDIQIPITLRPKPVPPKPLVRPKVFPSRRSEPIPPPNPLAKARSASSGDLLSDSSVCIQVEQPTRFVAPTDDTLTDDVRKLETEVALEMEKTRELLSRVSQSGGGGDGEGMPEDLLTKAMEKLEKADHVLREVNKLKPPKSSSSRKSW